jgi:all-trans-retinol dehydrogenase (NAD+)
MKDVKDKIVLITGGASGIGRLTGLNLARLGAKVLVWDLNAQNITKLEEEARAESLFIKGWTCDVSNRDDVYNKAEIIKAEIGLVDILINNAGVVSGSTFLKTTDEKILKTMDINTNAHFWTAKAFLPSMIERNNGHFVTISSAAGIIGVTGLADYSASKFAVFGFHEAIRMELRRLKSRVQSTIVCPFFIDTGMFQGVKTRFSFLLPILKPEYAAKRICKAIIKNKKRLIMPRFVYAVYFIRLLPVGLFDFISDFFGISNSMDDFTGRKES